MDGYATNRADLLLLAALGIYALLTGIRALWLKRPGDAFAGWYRAVPSIKVVRSSPWWSPR